jgi:hypothetical protein
LRVKPSLTTLGRTHARCGHCRREATVAKKKDKKKDDKKKSKKKGKK